MKINIHFHINVILMSLILLTSQQVFGYSGGITGYSGKNGSTCTACHAGGIAPSITLSGPHAVTPNSLNSYTLTISGGQQKTGGLDVSASAGILSALIAQTNTRLASGEITHTAPANVAANGTVSWIFDWRAPATLGSSTLYAASVSANVDGNNTGDGVANTNLIVSVSDAAPKPPVAVINAPMTAAIGATVSFDGSGSYDPDGTIYQYEWNFGDGHTAVGPQAVNAFSAAGIYTVTLKVTDNASLTSTTFVDITIGGTLVPVANLGGPYTGTTGQSVSFDAGQSSTAAIVRYLWDFGDGSVVQITTSPLISHSFAQPGSYTVALAVQDANNLTGFDKTVVVITDVSTPPPPVTDGPTLYANNCQSCHGLLASSSKLNRTATQIQTAISNNAGNVMGSLSGLSTAQIQAIAMALVSVTPPPTDGPTLYANNCQSCHGPLATSAKLNRTAAQIQTAITYNAGNVMGSLSGLTATQIQAIATALVSVTPPPTDGPTLYAVNCSGCHNPLTNSTKLNRTATQIQTAITNNAGNVMGTLSGLTSTQIQAIATALVSVTPPPTDGPTLYTTNCAGCHGPLATSAKLNRTATQIQTAITNNAGNVMGTLSGLTSTQIQAIATALVSVTPPPADGPTLYANNCQSCHGPLATSAKLNRTASQIQSAINGNAGGVMGSLSGLTTTQVQAIATALVSVAPPPPPPTDGATLYANNCQSCHGPLATSAKLNRTASQIQSAINGNAGGVMGSLSGLTATQVQAIATALVSSTSPTTGEGLYNSYCSACHGPGGRGGQYENVTGSTTSQISSAISGVQQMRSISLTSSQIKSISDYLRGITTTPPPTDGASLYGTYCQSCHGALATSAKLNRTATQITNAISSVGQMSTINLSSTQIQAIAAALVSTTTPPPTTDGASLYGTYCQSCHGALASSSKLNRSATQITNAISTVNQMNTINLTSTQIQSIAAALASVAPAPTTGVELYNSYCSSCHGPGGRGGTYESVRNATTSQITSAISRVQLMNSITLTSSQKQAIANYLSGSGSGGGGGGD